MVLRSDHYDDVYFSAQDGLAETRHVFLDGNDLPARWMAHEGVFTIAETGFGTGLNFLAALDVFKKTAPRDTQLHFISFEKHPLEADVIRQALQQWDLDVEALLSVYEPLLRAQRSNPDSRIIDCRVACAPRNDVSLQIYIGDVNDLLPTVNFAADAWFLDGFRPSSNPDMWTETVFNNMARLSNQDATFATFTAAGFVRRGLEASGFEVRKVPGFGRKREMAIGVLR